jgi:hypothetical protein
MTCTNYIKHEFECVHKKTLIGEKMTLAEVKKHPKLKCESVLISNMEINKIEMICYTRCGNCVPVGNNDTVIGRIA